MAVARMFLVLSVVSLALAGLTFLDLSRRFKILSLFFFILFLDTCIAFAIIGFSILLHG